MIRNITLGKMNNIRKSIILNVLASISNLIPFIALAKIVETLFLNRGADSIDTSLLWKYFGIMAIFFLITFLTWIQDKCRWKNRACRPHKKTADRLYFREKFSRDLRYINE